MCGTRLKWFWLLCWYCAVLVPLSAQSPPEVDWTTLLDNLNEAQQIVTDLQQKIKSLENNLSLMNDDMTTLQGQLTDARSDYQIALRELAQSKADLTASRNLSAELQTQLKYSTNQASKAEKTSTWLTVAEFFTLIGLAFAIIY